jgi:hypothetical protein
MMTMRLLLPILLLVGGCGTTADKACTDQANAQCNLRQMCSTGAQVTKAYGDLATCIARTKMNCLNALAAKGTGNSPSRVEQCVTATASESCSDFYGGNPPAACVNTGTLADSTACAFAGQCSSTYCTGLTNAACGTCGQAAASGASCVNGSATCARGQNCITTPGTMGAQATCMVEGAVGAACSRANPCGFGLSCVGSTMTAMGSCMSMGTTVGAACDVQLKTAPACNRTYGLWCNTGPKTCTAVTFVAAGAACGQGTDGNLTDCKASSECFGATFGMNPVMGTCMAPAADGAACDTMAGPPCTAPARCVTAAGSTAGTCTLADATKC